jgi:hypothetical protein
MLAIRAIVLRIACSSSRLSCKPDRRQNITDHAASGTLRIAHWTRVPKRLLIDGAPRSIAQSATRRETLTTLVIGSGLIGSQVARILVERGEKPVLMDHAAQPHAIGQIVDPAKVIVIAGDVLRPLSIVDALRI